MSCFKKKNYDKENTTRTQKEGSTLHVPWWALPDIKWSSKTVSSLTWKKNTSR